MLGIIKTIINASSPHLPFRPSKVWWVFVQVCWFGAMALVGSIALHTREAQDCHGTEASRWTAPCTWCGQRVHCHVTSTLCSTLHCFEILKKWFFLPFPQAKNSPRQVRKALNRLVSRVCSPECTAPLPSQPQEPV